ncbi:MAG: hypothetical protein ACRDMJ_05745, partial [Solirubrobacteraceae bacterium]
RGTVVLTVSVPHAGRIEVAETAGRTKLARLAARVPRAGSVHLTIRLSRHERHLLARAHRLRVRLSLTYTPDGGTPRTVSLRPLTLRTP